MRFATALFLLAGAAYAGGGPETTLLVVNGDSPLSRYVANEYAALRDIPAANRVELRGVPATLDYGGFKKKIWAPIRSFLDEHGENIDCIVYSTGFPCAVDLAVLLAGQKLDDTTTPVASLTGLTYLARRVEMDDPLLVDLHINKYFRRDFTQPVLTSVPLTKEDEKRFAAAMGAMMAGNPTAARDAYAAFLEHYTSHPMSWFNYAVCLAQTGEADAAIVALGKGIDVGWNDVKRTEEDPSLAPLLTNRRFQKLLDRMRDRQGKVQDAHGFRSRYRWVGKQRPTLKGAKGSRDRYFLSVMLGHAGERGNSVPEILAALKRTVAADGTEPQGTVYFGRNHDVRTRARDRGFAPAGKALKGLGIDSVVTETVFPSKKRDVLGVVAGIGNFDWGQSGSTLLPGAIAETLSSFGAAFDDKRDTKLSAWIRAGAAGTSGTVAEGFAVRQKFPHPSMHVHYAEGCSFAEAIYQSVSGPYQTLVVGDALARPFAIFATIEPNLPEGPWKGTVSFTPKVDPGADPIATCEAYINGRRVARAKEGDPLEIDTTQLDDGAHELRVVAIEKGRIQTRSYKKTSITIANAGREVTLAAPKKALVYGEAHTLRGSAPGATAVVLYDGASERGVGKVSRDGSVRIHVTPGVLGPGPVWLHARATYESGPAARSAQIVLRIDGPAPRPADKVEGLMPNLVRSGRTFAGDDDAAVQWSGYLRAPGTGFHQLRVLAKGEVTLKIGGKEVFSGAANAAYVPLFLADGHHEFELTAKGLETIVLNGHAVHAKPEFGHKAGDPLRHKAKASGKTARLVDGDRDGAASAVPPTGIELRWEKPVKPASLVLFPARGKRKEPWPTEWVIETKLGKSKWKKVKKLEVENQGSGDGVPRLTILRFRAQKCDTLRIKPVGRSVMLTEIEFFGK